jgi:hypothetical protein
MIQKNELNCKRRAGNFALPASLEFPLGLFPPLHAVVEPNRLGRAGWEISLCPRLWNSPPEETRTGDSEPTVLNLWFAGSAGGLYRLAGKAKFPALPGNADTGSTTV